MLYDISWQLTYFRASLVAQMVNHLPAMRETQVWSLGWEDPLEKEMATHSSTLAWKIPWTEEPGRLQPKGLQRVRHNWATSLYTSLILYTIVFASYFSSPLLPLSRSVSPVVTTSFFLYLWACFFLFFFRFHLSDYHISFVLFCLTYFTKQNIFQIHSCYWKVVEFHFLWLISIPLGFPGDSLIKNLSAKQETQVWSLGWEEKIPWRRKWQPTPVFLPGAEKPDRLGSAKESDTI